MTKTRKTRLAVGTSSLLLLGFFAFNWSLIPQFLSQGISFITGYPGADSRSARTGSIVVNVYDGQRRLVAHDTQLLVRIIDGNQNFVVDRFYKGPSLRFDGLPFHDNFGDNYTVIVWARGYNQAGFTPVKIKPGTAPVVDLMLLPSRYDFDFAAASWDALEATRRDLLQLLKSGVSESAARARYERLLTSNAPVAANLLNLTTALEETRTVSGSPMLPYFSELLFDDTMRKDRFFAYADARLIDELRLLVAARAFDYERGAFVFHPGATVSFKQRVYGEANLHLTFFENDRRTINGVDCVRVEVDIDYYRDDAAHAILEVIPHLVTGGKSDPRTVYQLRWIAARRAGGSFNPPYAIVERD